MSALRIVQETAAELERYQRIPMMVEVESVYNIVETADGGFELHEEPVATPRVKDYEAFEEDRPINLAKKYDFSVRGIFGAYDGETRVGGAIVAPGEEGWFGRSSAVLVDIRVHPSHRRHGVGQAILAAVVAWAKRRGLSQLMIETQNVNVPGCRFYASQGAQLHAVIPEAYPQLPGEIKLIWQLTL